MCGLVGIATNSFLSTSEKQYFNYLLYIDVSRGKDATGVASISNAKDRSVKIIKKAVPSYKLLSTKEYVDFVGRASKALIGHNRAATMGKVLDRNSHPFRYKHITLAHNGTLRDYSELPEYKSFKVDSEALTYAFAEMDDPKKVLESITGAFAVTWYDQKRNLLGFARNNERPLHFARNKNNTLLLWASEMEMLKLVLNGKNTQDNFSFATLNDHTLITVDLGPGLKVVDSQNLECKKSNYYNDYSGYYSKRNYYTPKNNYNTGQTVYEKEKEFYATHDLKNGATVFMEFLEWLPGGTPSGNHCGGTAYFVDPVKNITYKLNNCDDVFDDEDAIYSGTVHYYSDFGKYRPAIVVKDVVKCQQALLEHKPTEEYTGPNNKTVTLEEFNKLTHNGCINCGASILPQDHTNILWVNEGRDPMCNSCVEDFHNVININRGAK